MRSADRGHCLRLTKSALTVPLLLCGCARQPQTDRELTSKAQLAVAQKLGGNIQFSRMQAAVSQQIACGQAVRAGKPPQVFVYRDEKVIVDSDPDFDTAAVQCDAAAGGLPDPASYDAAS